MVCRADKAFAFHAFDPLGGGVVADAHLALEPRAARLLVLDHDLAGLAILALFRAVRCGEIVLESQAASVLRLFGDRVDIFGEPCARQKSATASTSSSDTNGPWTRTIAPVLGL